MRQFPGERNDRYPVPEITAQPVSNNGRRRGFRMHHALDHQIHAMGAPVLERIHGTMRKTTAGSGAKYIFLCHQTVRQQRMGNNILDKSSDSPYIYYMKRNSNQPKTLQEAVVFYSDPNNALAYMTDL